MQKQLNSGSIEGQSTLHIWAKRRSFQIIYERLPWINGALPLQEFLSRDICVSNLWIAMEYIENALGQLRNCSHQRGVLEEERCTRRAIRVRLMDFCYTYISRTRVISVGVSKTSWRRTMRAPLSSGWDASLSTATSCKISWRWSMALRLLRMNFAAYSTPVCWCVHFFTEANLPLRTKRNIN